MTRKTKLHTIYRLTVRPFEPLDFEFALTKTFTNTRLDSLCIETNLKEYTTSELLKVGKLSNAEGRFPSSQGIGDFGPVGSFIGKSNVEVQNVRNVASAKLRLESTEGFVQIAECSLEGQDLRYLLVVVGF